MIVEIAFAGEIIVSLSSPTAPQITDSFIDKFEKNIQNFPSNIGTTAVVKYGELDRRGTTLWNLCTRLKRNSSIDNQTTLAILMARVYALKMLHCAQSSGKGGSMNGVRVMKVALKSAKNCLGEIYSNF